MGDLIRGKIYNKARKQQIIDFSGLQYERKITPTDIDLAFDFMGGMFFFGEYKLQGYEMPYGQKLYFQNICNAIHPTPAIAFLAWHQTPIELEINAANCQVRSYYASRRWLFPASPVTVRDFVDGWREYPEQMPPEWLDDALTMICQSIVTGIEKHVVLNMLKSAYPNPKHKQIIWDALTENERAYFLTENSKAS